MPDKPIPLCHCLIAPRPNDQSIAYYQGQYYRVGQFKAAVGFWVHKFKTQACQRYALYCDEAYPFAVLLFALWHAGKQVWVPGNNRPGTAQQLPGDCQLLGDWQSGTFDYCLQEKLTPDAGYLPLDPYQSSLVVFTSGSTGQAKPITKYLAQLQSEVTSLEAYWGGLLGAAEALSTVSHQHIYGLLFKVLWPLFAGRCFHSQIYLNPEQLISVAGPNPAYWIASPAQLKRLDADSPWRGITNLTAIFSSGGMLPQAASEQIKQAAAQAVLEIYGSSETGGIAWRQDSQKPWQLFSGLRLVMDKQACILYSPYLANQAGQPAPAFQLEDQITLLADGGFELHGRADRIVKIEEKRLSLAELERRLLDSGWLQEVCALTSSGKRDSVAVVLVLNQTGMLHMADFGRAQLLKQLRQSLATWFDAVVLPRKWLLTNQLPLTPQGKIDRDLVKQLFDFDHERLPQVRKINRLGQDLQLDFKVPTELIYFADHFVGFPILPGVVQLAWAAHFGEVFFGADKDFRPLSQLESIKFSQIIKPGDELSLTLKWQPTQGRLQFKFSSVKGVMSSGRMLNNKLDMRDTAVQ